MPKVLTVALILVVLGLASPAIGQSFFLSYVRPSTDSPRCGLGLDPDTVQGLPQLPAAIINVNEEQTFDVCFLIWPIEASDTPLQTICEDGDGSESCSERARYAIQDIEVSSFTPVVQADINAFPQYQAQFGIDEVTLVGGDPVLAQQGQPNGGLPIGMRLATGTFKGKADGGRFELKDSADGYANASMAATAVSAVELIKVVNMCQNTIKDAGEDCDDGNDIWGDGCSPTCLFEDEFVLSGKAGDSASVSVDINSFPIQIFTTLNDPAKDVVQTLVAQIANAQTDFNAAQADDPEWIPGNGQRLVTDGMITSGPIVNDPNGNLKVPEPGVILGLLGGLVFLATVGRKRIRP